MENIGGIFLMGFFFLLVAIWYFYGAIKSFRETKRIFWDLIRAIIGGSMIIILLFFAGVLIYMGLTR